MKLTVQTHDGDAKAVDVDFPLYVDRSATLEFGDIVEDIRDEIIRIDGEGRCLRIRKRTDPYSKRRKFEIRAFTIDFASELWGFVEDGSFSTEEQFDVLKRELAEDLGTGQ